MRETYRGIGVVEISQHLGEIQLRPGSHRSGRCGGGGLLPDLGEVSVDEREGLRFSAARRR